MTPEEVTTGMLVNEATLFKCKSCGWCCESCDPIAITTPDIIRISIFLNKPLKVIRRKYTIPHPTDAGNFAFKRTKPCFFYNRLSKTCKIYPARPDVCIAFPILSELNLKHNSIELDPKCKGSVEYIEQHARGVEEFKKITEDPRFIAAKKHLDDNPELKIELEAWLSNEKLKSINKLWKRGQ